VDLEEPEAIGMDGTDKESTKLIECGWAETIFCSFGNTLSQLGGGALGEGKGHDPRSGHPLGQQVCDTLGHDLGLA
jgi:hypothetical protein